MLTFRTVRNEKLEKLSQYMLHIALNSWHYQNLNMINLSCFEVLKYTHACGSVIQKKKKIFSLFKRNVHWFVLINLPAWKDKFLAKTEEMISDQSIQSEMKTHKSKNQVENQSLCSFSRKRYPVSEKMSEEVDRYLFS